MEREDRSQDILIATFLIRLWERMYPGEGKANWTGFVDIGCGNGVLVDVLVREGWSGSGFDARARKSWAGFEPRTRERLREMVLVPYLLDDGVELGEGEHDGRFDEGTFIISNHADELTAWTPILAAASNCPFIVIPCCSHDLSGAMKRFPPPKDLQSEQSGSLRLNMNLSKSTYASLCAYVERIAQDCGWVVEREVLRIPSTRNVAVIGRKRMDDVQVDVAAVVRREGGATGWRKRIEALRQKESIGH
jgi:tRNASer (uridine44-2'-O)-methyltransferase